MVLQSNFAIGFSNPKHVGVCCGKRIRCPNRDNPYLKMPVLHGIAFVQPCRPWLNRIFVGLTWIILPRNFSGGEWLLFSSTLGIVHNSKLYKKIICMYLVNGLSLNSSLIRLLLKVVYRTLNVFRERPLQPWIYLPVLRKEPGYLHLFHVLTPAVFEHVEFQPFFFWCSKGA